VAFEAQGGFPLSAAVVTEELEQGNVVAGFGPKNGTPALAARMGESALQMGSILIDTLYSQS